MTMTMTISMTMTMTMSLPTTGNSPAVTWTLVAACAVGQMERIRPEVSEDPCGVKGVQRGRYQQDTESTIFVGEIFI